MAQSVLSKGASGEFLSVNFGWGIGKYYLLLINCLIINQSMVSHVFHKLYIGVMMGVMIAGGVSGLPIELRRNSLKCP